MSALNVTLVRAARRLKKACVTVAVAESCTGGMLGSMLTSVPGSSDWFIGGVIAYSNDVKSGVLRVGKSLLKTRGAVSSECAKAMASGVRKLLGSDIGVSITGIAGPAGGRPGKPVGLVYIGLDVGGMCRAEKYNFSGTRDAIRQKSCRAALKMMIEVFDVMDVSRRGTKGR